MILITGATGTTGRHVVKELSSKGEQVRALVRNSDRAKWLAGPNVGLVEGDFEDRESLTRALTDIDRAYLLTPTTSRRVFQEANFLEAALKTNLKLLVRLSILGAASDSPSRVLRRHGQADQQLKDSGIAFTILQPSYFMQNILWYAESIKNQGVFHASLPASTKHSHVDARDVAAVVVAALTETGHENHIYRLTGPEALTYNEMMNVLSWLLDKPVIYDPSPQNYANSLAGWGLDIDEVLELDRVIAQGSGDGSSITDTVTEIAKKAPFPFIQFAQDHLSAFKKDR